MNDTHTAAVERLTRTRMLAFVVCASAVLLSGAIWFLLAPAQRAWSDTSALVAQGESLPFAVRDSAGDNTTRADDHTREAPLDPAVAAEGHEAARLLGKLADAYEHLEGVTVRMGATPKGEQAVAYYAKGEILINPAHQDSIDEILAHEIWHVIDWRDNGKIDWGEDLPPTESSDYLRR